MTQPIYGPFSANADSKVVSSKPFSPAWGGPIIQGFSLPASSLGTLNTWDSNSGVYSGSLSSQGHLVATQLAPPVYNFRYANGDAALPLTVTSLIPGYPEAGANYEFDDAVNITPWYEGYFNTFMKDPTRITFGNNSAIPALTGVMPSSYIDMQGSLLYYLDLQINRLSGSNNWNNFYFISVMNQAIAWVTQANDFTIGLNNSESNNLAYYGADNYKDLTSNGFAKYQQGQALLAAFSNIGKIIQSVPSGKFGTANAVAKTLLAQGLGFVILDNGITLSTALQNAGVNNENIFNDVLTPSIEQILYQITDLGQLETIQAVLESSVRNISSPMDYTSIKAASGIENDSAFASFAEVGQDLHIRAPNFEITLGKTFADAVRNIQTEVSPSVETLANVSSLLPADIIANLRAYLPTTVNNQPAGVLSVIGMASGYLIDNILKINDGLSQLLASTYGSQIRDLLTKISQYNAKVPLDASQAATAANWVRIPPAQYTKVLVQYPTEGGTVDTYVDQLTNLGGPDYWDTQLELTKTQLFNLLSTVVADPSMLNIVKLINDNYTYVCDNLYSEHKNYNKANIQSYTSDDPLNVLSFVSSVPALIEDAGNIGTDLLLYGLAQPTTSGNIAKAVFSQAKNDAILTSIGSNPSPKV